MYGPVRVDELHEAVDQLLTFVVADFAESHAAAEVLIAIGIATGTAKRTLASDFD
jgi:hypothetical protein